MRYKTCTNSDISTYKIFFKISQFLLLFVFQRFLDKITQLYIKDCSESYSKQSR